MNRPQLLDKVKFNSEIHPICGLLGPRQAGKTTLARMYAEKYYPNNFHFFDLENPADLSMLDNPVLAISQVTKQLIIIDEFNVRSTL